MENQIKQTPWPKEGDLVRMEGTKAEGQVLSNENGVVKIDWGLFITEVNANELELVDY